MSENSKDIPMVVTYLGKNVEELSREELIEAVKLASQEIDSLRRENQRFRKSVDFARVLMVD